MTHLPLLAQSYDSLWKQVKEAEDKSLPKTVMELSDKIIQKAQKEKNAPQLFKAYLYKTQSQEEVTPDSIYPNFRYVEQWAKEEPNAVNRAILHSMLAGMYLDYLDRHAYELNQRTELAEGEVPDDMREWTRGIFQQQALAHANAVLTDVPALLKTSAKQYEPFSILGAGSEFYGHDMFHLLAMRTIGNLRELGKQDAGMEEIYQLMIHTYQGMKGREEATLMATLDYEKWKATTTEDRYRELIAQYDPYPAVMEAYSALASWLYRVDRPAEALEVIGQAVAKYPKYVRVNMLHRLKQEILQPYLSADMQKMLYPGDEAKLQVDFKNLQGLEVRLYRTGLQELPENEEVKPATLEKLGLQEVMNRHYDLSYAPSPNARYLRQKNTFELAVPTEPGVYLHSIAPTGEPALVNYQYMVVSRFKVLLLNLGDGQTEVVTLDSKTGQPIGEVEVTFFRGSGTHYSEIFKVTTDADGKRVFVSPEQNFMSYVARKGNDRAMLRQSTYIRNKVEKNEVETEHHLTLLTDRSIYRPGQTVYVKGICYTQKGEETQVAEGALFRLTLHDVNGKELSATDVITNDFGSFNASFVLPTAALNGLFSIRADGQTDASIRFRVEEYKRPTFEITFQPIKEAYRMGDTVELKGHVESFSGATVQNVPLQYRIVGNIWRWWTTDDDPQAADSVMVDGQGDFVIPIQLKTNDKRSSLSITVEATVTNEAGETQTASRHIWASSKAYSLGMDVPQYLKDISYSSVATRHLPYLRGGALDSTGLKGEQNGYSSPAGLMGENGQGSSFEFLVSSANADGQEQERDVRYRLYRVEKDTDNFEVVKKQTPVEEGILKGNAKHTFDSWSQLPSAKYMMELTVVGEEQLKEEEQSRQVSSFYLYRDTDQTFGTFMDTFLDSARDRLTFDEQHAASFMFGTSHGHAHVLMDVFAEGKRIDSQVLELDNELKTFMFPYQHEYGDGVTILFAFVKEDKVYERTVLIEKTRPKKQLDMKWEVFRDKLQPGQQEEWRLVIKTPDGSPASAEMLALLYDASLDKIYKRYQSLYVYVGRRLYSASHQASGNAHTFWSFYWKGKEYRVPEWQYDALDIPRMRFDRFKDFMVLESTAPMAVGRANTRLAKSAVVMNADGAMVEGAEEAEVDQSTVDDAQSTDNGQQSTGNDQPTVRTNFNETAFFYPALRTNKQGEVVLSFVMPESLTRWNFQGISHTQDMMTGNISATTVTQKDFMLQPNMPRFVRMGDQVSIAAVVANLTEEPVSGTVVFTLFDPITEQVIAIQRQNFQAAGKGNASVSFGFDVTEEYSLLGVRMVADGGKFSDGEQHVLPVLSNKQFITETLAMPIRGNQMREFSTASLFNHHHPSATQKKLTVEFTGNPAWYAVQALPEISEPLTDNAIAWASAFYGNTLASFIANSQPRIQQVFNRWKLEGGDKETLLSQLEKNQELKEILLSETPWVMEANTETERKQRLGIFFDLNQMSNRIQTDLIKLQGLQNEDGGWSWFSGMQSSFSTTTYITGLLIRLQMLLKEASKDGQMDEVNEMKERGFRYMHAEMLKHYQELVKAYGKHSLPKSLSYLEMQYLYLIAIGDMAVPAQNRVAYNHFLSLVDTNLKDGDVIDKAQSAIIQLKAGKAKSSQDFINSLKEHMVDEDEMGAHFAFLDKPYNWSMIPVPQHVATMEALQTVGGNDELIEEMKMWLLKQKQTRGWNSSICTVDAIYALLCRGANLLENKGDVQITVGDHVLNTVQRSTVNGDTPDLGYIKESFTDNQMVESPVIKVEKRDDGIAWGAAYAQYFTPMTDIQQHGKELNLVRKLYVERIGADGKKTLEQLTDGAKLHIGDVVVSRMTIDLDRAMDFVQLKDRPAACFEPVAQLSGYRWNLGCYMEVEDAATNFFFDSLGKGLHVLEVRYRVQRTGTYQIGASTVQSAYAPEFASHSNGITVSVADE